MKSLSSVGLGLSIVFGCLLLALVVELYYLLWWKRRFTHRGDDYSNPARELFYMFCLKKPSSLRHHSQELCSSVRITDTLVHHEQDSSHLNARGKDLLFKPFGDDHEEIELMRMQSLSGPPRFLFTIIEETKEDLESEEAKSRTDNRSAKGSRGRSLSDLLVTVETPYLTPLASPPFFTPPLTPMESATQNFHGFNRNPFSESSTDAEFNKIRSSPPPKFKFLQDAEEKLYRRKLIEQTSNRTQRIDGFGPDYVKNPDNPMFLTDEEDGSFITIIVDKNRDKELPQQQQQLTQHYHSSTSSQVLPLASSPSSTLKSAAKKTSIFN